MIEDIKKRLATINQKNGFLFDVPDIAESDSAFNIRSRGIALCRENGSVVISLNAKTRTLQQLKEYIGSVLDADFELIEIAEDQLSAKPKKGNDDAAT